MRVRFFRIAVAAVSVSGCAIGATDPWTTVATAPISGTKEQVLEIATANGAIRIDANSGSELLSVFLTQIGGNAGPRFELRAFGVCDGSYCLAEPVILGAGTVAELIATADLRGRARTISLYEENADLDCVDKNDCAPAMFFMTTHRTDHGESEYLTVVTAALNLKVLLHDMLANRTATGGFSTSSIELEASGGQLLDIRLNQSALPSPGDEDFRPGPPLSRTFRYRGDLYHAVPH